VVQLIQLLLFELVEPLEEKVYSHLFQQVLFVEPVVVMDLDLQQIVDQIFLINLLFLNHLLLVVIEL